MLPVGSNVHGNLVADATADPIHGDLAIASIVTDIVVLAANVAADIVVVVLAPFGGPCSEYFVALAMCEKVLQVHFDDGDVGFVVEIAAEIVAVNVVENIVEIVAEIVVEIVAEIVFEIVFEIAVEIAVEIVAEIVAEIAAEIAAEILVEIAVEIVAEIAFETVADTVG